MSEENQEVAVEEAPEVGIASAYEQWQKDNDESIVNNSAEAEVEAPTDGVAKEEEPTEDTSKLEDMAKEDEAPEDKPKDAPEDEDVPFGYEDEETPEDAPTEEFDEAAFDAETEEETKGMDAKANKAFKRLRTEMKEMKRKLADSPKSEEDSPETVDLQARVDEMQEVIDSLTETSYELKLQATPEWKEQYVKPEAEVVDSVTKLASDFEIEQSKLAKLVLEPNARQRVEAIKALMPDTEDEDTGETTSRQEERAALVAEVRGLSDKYQTAIRVRDELSANAKEKFEAIEAKRVEETKAQREARIKTHRQQVSNMASALQEKFGERLESYSAELEAATKRAAQMTPESMSPKDSGYATFAGAALPTLLKVVNKQAAELAELKGTKAKESDSKVNLTDGDGNDDSPTDTAPKTFAEMAAAAAASGKWG